jgi:hypothetical protein
MGCDHDDASCFMLKKEYIIPSSSLAPESASNRPIDLLGMMLD